MATYSTPFNGVNQRSLLSFITAEASDIEFISNPKKEGQLFAVLSNGKTVSVSKQITAANLSSNIGDYDVFDMPDEHGVLWPVITPHATNNVVGRFSFK